MAGFRKRFTGWYIWLEFNGFKEAAAVIVDEQLSVVVIKEDISSFNAPEQ